MGKHGSTHSVIPNTYIRKVPVIIFGKEQKYRGKTLTVSFSSTLKKDTRKTNKLNSQMKLLSKDKKSNFLSQKIASIWVLTEVDYTVSMDYKPTKDEFEMLGKAQKYITRKTGRKF